VAGPTISISWDDVSAVAPALSTIPIATQTAILADLPLRMRNAQWGAMANMGAKYLAAHLAALSLRAANGPVGPVTEAKVGPVQQQWAAPLKLTNYSMTPWGLEYERIRDNVFRFPMVAGGINANSVAPSVPADCLEWTGFWGKWGW
jgi:uncharacterized protein DUF4054